MHVIILFCSITCSLVDDLNQQLLPRVCSLSKQLDELYDSMIVSPSDEMNNCFVSEEVPRGVSENKHSEVASEQHMPDDATAAVDEIQREGEEKEEDPLR